LLLLYLDISSTRYAKLAKIQYFQLLTYEYGEQSGEMESWKTKRPI